MSYWLSIGGAALVQDPTDVEVDYPAFGDWVGFVEVHQFVQGGEFFPPQEVMTSLVPQQSVMHHALLIPENRFKSQNNFTINHSHQVYYT